MIQTWEKKTELLISAFLYWSNWLTFRHDLMTNVILFFFLNLNYFYNILVRLVISILIRIIYKSGFHGFWKGRIFPEFLIKGENLIII